MEPVAKTRHRGFLFAVADQARALTAARPRHRSKLRPVDVDVSTHLLQAAEHTRAMYGAAASQLTPDPLVCPTCGQAAICVIKSHRTHTACCICLTGHEWQVPYDLAGSAEAKPRSSEAQS